MTFNIPNIPTQLAAAAQVSFSKGQEATKDSTDAKEKERMLRQTLQKAKMAREANDKASGTEKGFLA